MNKFIYQYDIVHSIVGILLFHAIFLYISIRLGNILDCKVKDNETKVRIQIYGKKLFYGVLFYFSLFYLILKPIFGIVYFNLLTEMIMSVILFGLLDIAIFTFHFDSKLKSEKITVKNFLSFSRIANLYRILRKWYIGLLIPRLLLGCTGWLVIQPAVGYYVLYNRRWHIEKKYSESEKGSFDKFNYNYLNNDIFIAEEFQLPFYYIIDDFEDGLQYEMLIQKKINLLYSRKLYTSRPHPIRRYIESLFIKKNEYQSTLLGVYSVSDFFKINYEGGSLANNYIASTSDTIGNDVIRISNSDEVLNYIDKDSSKVYLYLLHNLERKPYLKIVKETDINGANYRIFNVFMTSYPINSNPLDYR